MIELVVFCLVRTVTWLCSVLKNCLPRAVRKKKLVTKKFCTKKHERVQYIHSRTQAVARHKYHSTLHLTCGWHQHIMYIYIECSKIS